MKTFDWHFWNAKHRVQFVVEAKTLAQAKKQLREMFEGDTPPEFTFQFGSVAEEV